MAIQNEIIWAEFLGNGFVAGPFTSTTVATVTSLGNDVYNVIINWADIYGDTDRMTDNVGARVYVEGFSTLNVPDGYYTIVDATGTNSVTIAGIFDPAPITGIPTTAGSITIEDFYKFSNGIPDFVTGESAQSRWLTIISDEGVSSTIGQRIGPRGGVSSFDGFSITLNFLNDTELTAAGVSADTTQKINAYKRLIRSQAEFALDTDLSSMALYTSALYTDQTLVKRGTTDLLASFKSSDASFNFIPAMIDREAVLLISTSAAGTESRDIACRRGLLGTGDGLNGTFHVEKSAFYSGIQTGQAALCRVRSLPVDATTYDFKFVGATNEIVDEGLIYSGMVENVKFGDNLSSTSFELSPQIYGSGKNSFAAKVATVGTLTDGDVVADRVYTFLFNAKSPQPSMPWKWIKLNSDIAVKLREEATDGGYDPTANPTIESTPADEPGLFDTKTIVDTIVWDPTNVFYNDNYVILTPSTSDADFAKKSRFSPTILGTAGEEESDSFLIQSPTDGLYDRDNVLNTGVITLDGRKFMDAKPELCHVFEPTTSPAIASLTACYEAFIRIPELLLQILTSDAGDSSNGTFDVLPYGMGLAINQNDINFESFGYDVVSNTFNTSLSPGVLGDKIRQRLKNVFVSAKDTENINKWLDSSVLKPFNLGLIQESNGQIKLIDTTFLKPEAITLTETLVDDDLSFDHNSRNFSFRQSYDASNLFQSIIVEYVDPTVPPAEQSESIITLASEIINDTSGEAGVYARLYTYIQAAPLKYKMPFVPEGTIGVVKLYTDSFSDLYSKILPSIEFAASSTKFNIGDKISIDLDTITSPVGSRGFTGYGIVMDKKTNIFARQSQYKVFILADRLLDFTGARVWSPSAKVAAGSTVTTINVEQNEFVPTDGTDIGSWLTDSDGFVAGDEIILYDKNFVLLSVDGGTNQQPRTVSSTTATTIVINAPFTDSGGANITPAADYILMHADKNIQPVDIQANFAWINDDETTW